MPNTLAHIGIQSLASKGICRSADFKWIAVGCIIPDIPWITQRIIHTLVPGINNIDLRLYAIIQASLFFSILLGGAISLLAKDSRKIFFILAGNSFLHLLLDALQIKWANGVHLLAPFSWQLTGFHLFWPEQIPTHLMTLLGMGMLLFFGIKDGLRTVTFTSNRHRLALAALLGTLYVLSPFLYFQGPLQADNHFLTTLLEKEHRTGRHIEFDRCHYDPTSQTIDTITGEKLMISGLPLSKKTLVSLQGRFINEQTVQTRAYHVHYSSLRDISSLIGLLSILIIWIIALLKKRCKVESSSGDGDTAL
jgi:hypothetical protein